MAPTKSQPPVTPVTGWTAPRVHRVQPVAMVPMRPRSRVLRASIKSQPPVTLATGLLAVRVLRVMRLHTPFKATARSVNPVRQVRTPTLELAPPAPRVHRVQPVAMVPMRPRSRVLRASIKSQPPVTLATGLLAVRVLRVMRLHTPFKATARSVNPVRQVRTPTLELAPPAPRVKPVIPVAPVPTWPQSRARRAPTKSRPLATPVTGWLKVRVLRVMRLHTPFKATARSVNPVRQVRTPTLELAPPAPRVHRVQPVAMVPTRPRSRARRAPTKSRPLATPVTGWLKVRVLRVMRLHTPFKATARSVNPVRQVRTPTLELAPPAPRVHRVQPVAMVPMRPRSRVLRASIKSQPLATPVTGWLKVRVLRVMRFTYAVQGNSAECQPCASGSYTDTGTGTHRHHVYIVCNQWQWCQCGHGHVYFGHQSSRNHL